MGPESRDITSLRPPMPLVGMHTVLLETAVGLRSAIFLDSYGELLREKQ